MARTFVDLVSVVPAAAKRMAVQDTLQKLWLHGKNGGLFAREQLKAWALREAWMDGKPGTFGMNTWIAERLTKMGGGRPTSAAVKELLGKIDNDEDWYPGKQYGEKRGRKRVLRGAKALAVARCAQSKKARGVDPTYAQVCGSCKDAVINPATGKPVDKRAVYAVFKERCYDDEADPDNTWSNRPRLSRKAITEDVRGKRQEWAAWMLGLRHTGAWYFNNLVWTDICNAVLPRTEKKAAEQALARKNGKAWMSDGFQRGDKNLRSDKRAVKMNSWDTLRVWWAPVLARGKLSMVLLPADFPGDRPEGAEPLVAKVRAVLSARFRGAPKPCTLFVDRGAGFYNAGTGGITPEFKAALADHGLRAFMGDDASQQPGSLWEMMFHETAVSWIRRGLTWTLPPRPWEETPTEFARRLRAVVEDINARHRVEGLCRELPQRVRALHAAQGGRLDK